MTRKISKFTLLLFSVVILLSISVVFTYVDGNNSFSSLQSSNNALVGSFMSAYSIPNTTSIDQFYGNQVNNTIVVNCNNELIPSFPELPYGYLGTQKGNEYSTIIKDMGVVSICSFLNSSKCGAAEANLSAYISGFNRTVLDLEFNQTKSEIDYLYHEVVVSNLTNLSAVKPIIYDEALFNTTDFSNASDIANAIVSMKSLEQNTADFKNGTVVSNDIYLYGPFQFRTVHLINATPCGSPNKVFNLITNSTEFVNPVYASLYSWLKANTTNICIYSGSNQCGSAVMKQLGASFYVK